jgi:Immunoglobulin-like domain of bacterial spore germination/Sporulation and spore germination
MMVEQFEGADEFEARVRDALRGEAEKVEPSGEGLLAIRERTGRGGSAGRARTRWYGGGAAVLATAAAVTAIAVLGSSDLSIDLQPGPAGPAVDTAPVQLYFLDSTPEKRGEPGYVSVAAPGLYRETHEAPAGADPVEDAVRELVRTSPTDPDYANPWQGITVSSVRSTPAGAVVDVSALPSSGKERESALQALAQTVATAGSTGNATRVSVEVNGQPAMTVGAADPVGTFAGIWVLTPEQGTAVHSPVAFSGMAATFEGNVAYEIRDAGGVVAQGATTTTGGMGVWSSWSVIQRLAPGSYTVTVFDEAPALGGRRDVDTKAFSVE